MNHTIIFDITAEEENRCTRHDIWLAYVNERILAELILRGFMLKGQDVLPFDINVQINPRIEKNDYMIEVQFEREAPKVSHEVNCSNCGVRTKHYYAEFIEGDGGIVPDCWVCDRCQDDERRSCERRA